MLRSAQPSQNIDIPDLTVLINNLEYGIQIYDCENALNILDILSESSYRAIFITLSIEACTRRGQCQIFRTIYIQYRLLTYLTIYDIFTCTTTTYK